MNRSQVLQKSVYLPHVMSKPLNWQMYCMILKMFVFICDSRVVEFLRRCQHPDGGYGGIVLIMY